MRLLNGSRRSKDISNPNTTKTFATTSFPYLQSPARRLPRIEVTRKRALPAQSSMAVRQAGQSSRGCAVLQKVFSFRTCSLDIEAERSRWRWFRPCLLALDPPVHGTVQSAHQQGRLPQGHWSGCELCWKAIGSSCSKECGKRWGGGKELKYEKRPVCATKSKCSKAS